MSEILRAHAAAYAERAGPRLPPHVRSVLAQLVACGTETLGSHVWCCGDCGETRRAYNACRQRHCPSCGGARRAAWLDQVSARILPVTHFHLVFTVPHELSRLILANRRELYGLLFRAAWETLDEVARDPRHLGAAVGAIMVLHTWGQTLEHHPHVHAVVPGGGLSLDGARWIAPRGQRAKRSYFLPVRVLSRVFRGKFLAGLRALRASGKLTLAVPVEGTTPERTWAEDGEFARCLARLSAREWVVFSQPPARADQGPAAVLKYLARYVAGAAISDARIVTHDPQANDGAGRVEFRAKNYRHGRKRMTLQLTGAEFSRRFALHILPRGFTRIRYYGLLAHRDLAARVDHCRARLAAVAPAVTPVEPVATPVATASTNVGALRRRCPACGAATWEPVPVGFDSRPTLWTLYVASAFFHERPPARPPP